MGWNGIMRTAIQQGSFRLSARAQCPGTGTSLNTVTEWKTRQGAQEWALPREGVPVGTATGFGSVIRIWERV